MLLEIENFNQCSIVVCEYEVEVYKLNRYLGWDRVINIFLGKKIFCGFDSGKECIFIVLR